MKDVLQFWNRVAGRTYSAVNTANQDTNPTNQSFESNKSKKRKRNRRFISLLFLSTVGLCTGLFILFVQPYDRIYKWKNIFGEGGEIYELWRKPEVNLYLQVYLFNVTNSEEFMSGVDKKIKVEQVGPYIYKENLQHGNVSFNDNGTLTTIPLHPLEWQPQLSYPRTEHDIVIMPNIAYLSIAQVLSAKSIFVRMGLNALLKSTGAKPLVEMTAKEFMFGYTSSLVTLGNSFLPSWIKFDKLGLIDRMYDFDGDYETIYTGERGGDDYINAGLIDSWRGSRVLPQWGDNKCGQVHLASDGSKYPGKLKDGDEILFYRKSLCRAAPLIKADEGVKDGLRAFKYVFKENILDNGHKNPENKCFCRNGNCLKSGLIDVTECYYGFPIALSYPHFLDSDESLVTDIEGIKPEEYHRSDIWIQPESGLPLEVNVKFQINIAMGNIDNIHGGNIFSKLTVPLLWFEFKMHNLPESLANRFRLYLKILPEGERIIMWIGFLIVAPTLAAALLVKLRRPSHHIPKRTPIIWDDNSPYAKSLRKMSLEIEKSKMQSVYIPCELPLPEQNEFLSSNRSSSEDETEVNIPIERRESLIKVHAEKHHNFSSSIGNRLQSIKNFTLRRNNDNQQTETNQSSEEDNFDSEIRRFSVPGDILGNVNYQMVNSSDDECCDLEIVDDGSTFDPTPEEIFRRQSVDVSDKIERLNMLETDKNSY